MAKVIKTKSGKRCYSEAKGRFVKNSACGIGKKAAKKTTKKATKAKSKSKSTKKCPAGKVAVKGYKRDGSVSSYCRKAPKGKKRGKK